jgi:hypothetical protein
VVCARPWRCRSVMPPTPAQAYLAAFPVLASFPRAREGGASASGFDSAAPAPAMGTLRREPIETAGRGVLWRVCALAFQAGEISLIEFGIGRSYRAAMRMRPILRAIGMSIRPTTMRRPRAIDLTTSITVPYRSGAEAGKASCRCVKEPGRRGCRSHV